ncbi:ribosomal protein S5 domain 2-type protein [Pyronema omphalodes]|nr:ribosomal protein S5 domain 2-type protein [Pyronema omphalodes]
MTSTHQLDIAPIGLSFSAQTFQKLAPDSFLLRHLQRSPPTRPSKRAPDEFRSPTLHTGALAHAQGSAVVRVGDTAVVCGIRGEIHALTLGEGRTKGKISVTRNDAVEDEIKTHALLVPNLELGTGCSKDYHPGPPTDFAQSVAERLRVLLVDTVKMVPAETLRITDDDGEIKAYWVLYIDVVCNSLDGNIFDAAWAAVVSALKSTRLPKAFWDADREQIMCDPDRHLYRRLEVRELAFTASFCVYTNREEEGEGQKWLLSDPDEFEEGICDEKVLVCVREGGKIARIEKSGGDTDVLEIMPECIRRAKARFDTWKKMLDSQN